MKIFTGILITLLLLSSLAGQEAVPRIVVTAARTPASEHLSVRNVIIISRQEIEESGFQNLDEVLNYSGMVDIVARHQNVQSDTSVRGTTFEQSLVMIDGVVFNNPQTGHHNLNLPVTLNDIDHIEIVPGQSSSLFGSYGFGGTINVITRDHLPSKVLLSFRYGSFNTIGSAIGLNYSFDRISFSFNAEKERSDGFQYDTDHDILRINTTAGYYYNSDDSIKLNYGMILKDFGAYDFYSPGSGLPSRETIDNSLISLNVTKRFNSLYLQPKLFYMEGSDDFILTIEDPGYFRSSHDTVKYGMDILLSINVTDFLT
ncbi:MAG: TonB-dependent receptor plug domain-containing protein, partial [Spirochaetes bacterium]|nr:TonB-dependent receptor plug domain-containing protein [Spirochaetota bacterium]